MLIRTSITARPMQTHNGTFSADPMRRTLEVLELEINELSWLIAHAYQCYNDHGRNQKTPECHRKSLIKVSVCFPVLRYFHRQQKGHAQQCGEPRHSSAIIEIAEVGDQQRRELHDLRQRMSSEQKPSVTDDYEEPPHGDQMAEPMWVHGPGLG